MITKQIEWNTGSGNITLTYQGQGDGTVTVQSDANDGAARSQTIVIETTAGSPVVTKSLTVTQGACPVPVGTVLNYAYTGSYQEVELPAGQYKLQCWGAQGGSNAAASSYSITAQAGGKGGYSEGVLKLTSKTTVRIYVGGAGSSSAGGFNGGGSTSGSASYNSGDTQGVSRMGGGGGATDIRLSDGALLSRMIVAGGGSGGAMCYKKETTTTTTYTSIGSLNFPAPAGGSLNGVSYLRNDDSAGNMSLLFQGNPFTPGKTYRIRFSPTTASTYNMRLYIWTTTFSGSSGGTMASKNGPVSSVEFTAIATTTTHPYVYLYVWDNAKVLYTGTVTFEEKDTTTTTTETNDSRVGYVGGGASGDGYSSTYQGKQNAAGSGGSFGQGANQTTTNYRFASGAGGGGWYGGGGGQYSDSSMSYCKHSGGGSGFVNTAASAGNRPSGYTGLQLDSGGTKAGNTSFPNTAGTGNETGHSGNGYARITRIS